MQKLKQLNALNNKKIVLDTGPLTVLLGCYDKNGNFDAQLARNLFSSQSDGIFYENYGEYFVKMLGKSFVIITPHVLSEVSGHLTRNHIKISTILHDKNVVFRLLVAQTTAEVHTKLSAILQQIQSKENLDFGVTDCGLITAAKSSNAFLITDDSSLEKLAKKSQILAYTPQRFLYERQGRGK